MARFPHRTLWILFLTALMPSVSAAQRPEAPDTLTGAEREVAARVATSAVARFRTDSLLYLVALELIRPKEPGGARLALVTHYRYQRDLAILTTVDLSRGAVVAQDSVTGLSVPLAADELDHARALALADSQVIRAVGSYRDELRLEAIPIRAAAESDPFFGHRVVRILFRVRRGYLEEPVVYVDLTAGRVVLEGRRQ